MQATADGGGGGGGDLSRAAGLARFRSAPATWLDALLEDDLTIPEDPPKPQVGLTQLLTAGAPASRSSGGFVRAGADSGLFDAGSGSGGGFHRMNSSPAEFLSGNIDGYFSSFGIPASYEYVGSSAMDVGAAVTGKRMRESDSEQNSSANFAAHRREQGAQLQTANSLLDMEMEKLLEDTVPCRVRAKRGCATHPRSIAERVRRTRISDRIRKLQELVPNMDKQTNTADMLDEAVEYVKTLQRQIHELSEQQKRCKCTAKS